MTPTLSQLYPLSRLPPLRRLPFWAQALALCALFAIAGVVALEDYGIARDEITQRQIARANLAYIATGATDALYDFDHRYYGIAIEMPLLLAERALGLQDSRHIHLTRHLLAHLFFIAGGFACGMLAYRMLGSRWIALLAMLIFLLHPRLYAHSFFNSKDVPFAVMLLIALYLTHRAFRKDTLGAFLLCGIGVGLAINLRPFALMLLPMIIAMRALDLWQSGRDERMRIIASAGIFAAAAIATVYITHPYYWENPLRFTEVISALSQHPNILETLFMGKFYGSDAVPWNYIPVWFAITAPPLALALGALGAAAVCWQAITRPIAALRDREIRFRILLLGCFALPVVAVIALQSNIYHGWRQMYFLWAPFCLLAAVGIHEIANIRMGSGIWKVGARLPRRVRGGGLMRAPVYAAAGVGLLTTLTAMAALHPNQQVYFNALVDTETPGALAKRYAMDYWQVAQLQSLEHLLVRYPDGALRVWPKTYLTRMLPQEDRERIIDLDNPHATDFYLLYGSRAQPPPFITNLRIADFYNLHPRIDLRSVPWQQPIHDIRAYGSVLVSTVAKPKDARAYRAAYDDVAANGTPLARSAFDIYAYDGALYYISDSCEPPMSKDAAIWVFLHIVPADLADLPADRREHSFENRDFRLDAHAAFFDGKCMDRQPLPDYPIARIRTGQSAEATGGGNEWRADVDLAASAAAQAVHDRILAGDYGKPVAQSRFDVYLSGNSLAYIKEPCADDDTGARLFLHIFPADPANLSVASREFGFANLDFKFADHGSYAGDICVATRELPYYAIERIRTGQLMKGEVIWRTDIDLIAHATAQAVYESILAGDYGPIVAQSHFDIYLRDNTLAYIKTPCAPADTHARFFLHIIPTDPTNLPAANRERGFVNLDFHFADHGAYAGDICAATIALPDYPLDRIRAGQFVSDEGAIWRVEFTTGR